MTQYWTRRRKWSLAIHVAFVLVPFTLSTVSALLFWAAMFGGNWYLAVPMVAVIEVLSLVGLVLFLTKIESPFVYLRHLLPFISIVPLGRELYLLLAHNTPLVAWSLTVVATAVLVVIAWQCFRTIERLFIDPVAAARERAHEQAEDMARTLAQAEETISILHGFLTNRNGGLVVMPAAPQGLIAEDTLIHKREVAARMRDDGRSWREIADAVGRSPSTVREWLAVPATNDSVEV